MLPTVKDSKQNPDGTEINGIFVTDFTGTKISGFHWMGGVDEHRVASF